MTVELAFEALTGKPPYPWQLRLHADWLAGRRAPALDLPTGLGKTAVMAIWLLALAGGAALPRRLVYVVDRRAVVDQASAEAEQFAAALASDDPRLDAVREGLRLGLEGLPISTLRGQHQDNRRWLQRPEAPAIVVGTVDMIGSRLLFSGYGVGRRMRSVHAGLLGVDALVVLDEAHLVPPFEALVEQAALQVDEDLRRNQDALGPLPGLRLLSLSATGRAVPDRFTLNEDDLADPRTAVRLSAVKRVRLHQPVTATALPQALADLALERAGEDAAVVVYANSRKVAQAVRDILDTAFAKVFGKGRSRVELLTGERRVHERARLTASPVYLRFVPGLHAADAEPPTLTGPVVLVATSAGEVGVDLDADHLVCDLVAWERMVQRLGRVNRRPIAGHAALIEVVPALTDKSDKEAEQAVADLAPLLAPFLAPGWVPGEDGRLEAGPAALLALRTDPAFAVAARAAGTEAPLRPALTRALVQAWSMTSLETHPGRPRVSPWLRGWIDDEPQARVLWRAHLPLRRLPDGAPVVDAAALAEASDFFEDAPPHLSETLEAPAWRIADVLKARAKGRLKQAAAATTPNDEPVLILLGRDNRVEAVLTLGRLLEQRFDGVRDLAGRTIVVDARLGGLDADGLLDPKSPKDGAPVSTLDNGGWDAEALKTVGYRVELVKVTDEDADAWRTTFRLPLQEDAADPDELRVQRHAGDGAEPGDPALTRWAQRLDEHQRWAGDDAEAIGRGLHLPPEAIDVLRLAAELHDEGKARREWQRAVGMAEDGRGAWAKSGKRLSHDALPPTGKRRDGHASPALMAGYRHEFGSLRDALASDRLPADEGSRDLVLHLIASHHGHARPTIPAYDPDWPPSASAALAQGVALRFARLEARWGPWGLAWWEALLRAADWRASARLNAQASEGAAHG